MRNLLFVSLVCIMAVLPALLVSCHFGDKGYYVSVQNNTDQALKISIEGNANSGTAINRQYNDDYLVGTVLPGAEIRDGAHAYYSHYYIEAKSVGNGKVVFFKDYTFNQLDESDWLVSIETQMLQE